MGILDILIDFIRSLLARQEKREIMRKCNIAGLSLIKQFEGCKLKSYQDSVGVWTVGYGHTGSDTGANLTITQERAEELLKQDIIMTEAGVERNVKVPITDNQFAALVSWTFNLGVGRLNKSSLLRLLNEGKDKEVALEFAKWTKAGGSVLPGLVKRRAAEADLFNSGLDSLPKV